MQKLIGLLACCLLLAACRSGQHVTKEKLPVPAEQTTTKAAAEAEVAAAYVSKVAALQVNRPCITASAKVSLQGMGKDLNVSGQLRMKRDDVVRLSLRTLGFEVAVLEFTPQDVLMVDRINKQYVRAAYSEVSFLRQANLDFYALQSLFWNELFVPGQRKLNAQTAHFHLSHKGAQTLLTLTDTPKLAYTFYTNEEAVRIDELQVKGRNAGDKGSFCWTYAGFREFAGRHFPTQMQMQVSGTGKDMGLSLTLSNLKNDTDWNTRTTVSAKYTRRSVNEVLKGLNL